MSCFGLDFVEQMLIWLVVVGAVVAVVRLLLPYVLGNLGEVGSLIMRILNILMWAVVIIFIIVVCFDLFSCLLGSGGGLHLGRPLH